MNDKPEVPAIPSLQEAQKALVMFVSDLARDESAPEAIRQRASDVVADWMMAGIVELARRAGGDA